MFQIIAKSLPNVKTCDFCLNMEKCWHVQTCCFCPNFVSTPTSTKYPNIQIYCIHFYTLDNRSPQSTSWRHISLDVCERVRCKMQNCTIFLVELLPKWVDSTNAKWSQLQWVFVASGWIKKLNSGYIRALHTWFNLNNDLLVQLRLLFIFLNNSSTLGALFALNLVHNFFLLAQFFYGALIPVATFTIFFFSHNLPHGPIWKSCEGVADFCDLPHRQTKKSRIVLFALSCVGHHELCDVFTLSLFNTPTHEVRYHRFLPHEHHLPIQAPWNLPLLLLTLLPLPHVLMTAAPHVINSPSSWVHPMHQSLEYWSVSITNR